MAHIETNYNNNLIYILNSLNICQVMMSSLLFQGVEDYFCKLILLRSLWLNQFNHMWCYVYLICDSYRLTSANNEKKILNSASAKQTAGCKFDLSVFFSLQHPYNNPITCLQTVKLWPYPKRQRKGRSQRHRRSKYISIYIINQIIPMNKILRVFNKHLRYFNYVWISKTLLLKLMMTVSWILMLH